MTTRTSNTWQQQWKHHNVNSNSIAAIVNESQHCDDNNSNIHREIWHQQLK